MRAFALLLIASAVALASCVSETFTLNDNTPALLYGRILSDVDSVQVVQQTALHVHSGGVAAVRNYSMTQCRWELLAKLTKGTETIYRVRTLPVERKLIPSIDIVYSTTGCRVEQGGKVLVQNDTVRAVPGVEEKIQVTNDGSLLTVEIGCTRVFHQSVAQPSTEWLVVESPHGSEVVISRMVTEDAR